MSLKQEDERYNVIRFLTWFKNKDKIPMEQANFKKVVLEDVTKDNLILQRYPGSSDSLRDYCTETFDLSNHAFSENIQLYTALTLMRTPAQYIQQLKQTPDCLYLLRRFIEMNPKGTQVYNFNDDLDLAKLMCSNLLKANSEVRLASLTILKMFKPLTFVDKEGLSDNFKGQECLCIDQMYEF